MAIVFQRELPAVRYATVDLAVIDAVKASPSGGRLINYTQVDDPAWGVTLVTNLLLPSEFAALEAWWLSLRGGLRTALFRHPWTWYPRAHVNDQAAANDAGNLVSVVDGNILSINGVDAGLRLQPGDFLGLERAGRFYLGRISEVSGAGANRMVAVEPPPFDTVAQPGAVVRFARPALVMRAVPGSFQSSRSGRFYTVSFQLRESP